MIDTQALKSKVLDLAMRGKLTEQLLTDGSGEDFYNAITTKPKRCTPISSNDIPFSIPANWKWCRFSAVADFRLGKTPARGNSKYWEKGKYPWISISDMSTETLTATKELISQNAVDECFHSEITPRNTLIMSFKLTIGKVAILGIDAFHNEAIISVFPRYDVGFVFRDYLKIILPYASKQGKIYGAIKGNTLNKDSISDIMIPLPPFDEQKRIIERISYLFSVLNIIETFQNQFASNLSALKTKLIDSSIRGKLTEQLKEDGTAETLYQQIQTEKQSLIRAGKIKNEKQLFVVGEYEAPFEIPASWKWVSVGEVCANIQYGSSEKTSASGKMIVLRMGNIQSGKIVYDDLAYTSDDVVIKKYPLEKNDLLFNRTNSLELVGKTAIYKGEHPATYAGYLIRITPVLFVSDYLNYVMQSQHYWNYCNSVRSDSVGQSNINAEKLKRFVFPLPPLAEQKRIVAKLDELLKLVEEC